MQNPLFSYSAALITIAAIDLDRLLPFYTVLLGQEPQPYQPQVYGGFQVAGLDLGIFQPNPNNIGEFQHQGGGAVSLCLSVNNIEAVIEYLAAAGYPQTTTVMTASHGRECYIYDPEENRIILHQGQKLNRSISSKD
jgi:predicted enzyme related to lactoylglutathione lyase